MTIKELFEQDFPNKSIMLYLRNPELQQELINLTNFLPETVSISERAYCYKNKITTIPLCNCGKPLRFHKMDKGYFATCGDKACKVANVIKSNKERDYTESVIKAKETYKAKTGYEHPMQNPEFKKEFFDAIEKKTGERYVIASEKSKAAREKTFKEKYGTTEVGKILHSDTAKQTIIEKYGSLNEFHKQRTLKAGVTQKNNELSCLIFKLKEMNYTFVEYFLKDNITPYLKVKCNKCNKIFEVSRQAANIYYRTKHTEFCRYCDYKNNTYRSNFEKEVLHELIKLLPNTEIQTNKRIAGFECDIVIPEYNLIIECNGLYWHSELYKDKIYHKLKKEAIEKESNVNLIYIWEDDWHTKKDIIISRLKSKLNLNKRIYARQCIIKKIDSKTCTEFLSNNHLQGSIKASIRYGLYYNNELVEVIAIGKSRKAVTRRSGLEYELLRFASKQEYTIIGGFSKLINAFKKEYKNIPLISYIDLSWSSLSGDSYIKTGFTLLGITEVDYWWVNNKQRNPIRENRLQYQKHKLIESGSDKNKTEIEIMNERGYIRVFGPGNLIVQI